MLCEEMAFAGQGWKQGEQSGNYWCSWELDEGMCVCVGWGGGEMGDSSDNSDKENMKNGNIQIHSDFIRAITLNM